VTDCIFCQIVAGTLPSSKVYEDEICLAFMDIQPVNPGHMLLVSKMHFADLADLPANIGAHIFQVAQRIALTLLQTAVKSEGVDLFLAHGEAAGQEIFHVHLHVIPRYEGDGFGFSFGTNYSKLPERSELDAIATQIRNQMEK
jgi:histidine triad (HIT) family protein